MSTVVLLSYCIISFLFLFKSLTVHLSSVSWSIFYFMLVLFFVIFTLHGDNNYEISMASKMYIIKTFFIAEITIW